MFQSVLQDGLKEKFNCCWDSRAGCICTAAVLRWSWLHYKCCVHGRSIEILNFLWIFPILVLEILGRGSFYWLIQLCIILYTNSAVLFSEWTLLCILMIGAFVFQSYGILTSVTVSFFFFPCSAMYNFIKWMTFFTRILVENSYKVHEMQGLVWLVEVIKS